jgi:UTP--glucose-1-phosphate uridylyltransferase
MISLLDKEKVYAYNFKGIRYDIGSKEGYLKATIDYSLRRDDLKEEILKFIKEKVQ